MPRHIQISTASRTHDLWVWAIDKFTGQTSTILVTLPVWVASMAYINERLASIGCTFRAYGLNPQTGIVAPF